MTRGRKPSVNYAKRHEWLDKIRAGTSPPFIAEKEGFDVRTVRRAVEIAVQENESAAARTMVYRDALQRHFNDLCGFAEKMDTTIHTEERVDEILDPHIWSALRQHIPASPMWRLLSKWNELLQRRDEDAKKLKERIRESVRADLDVKARFSDRNAFIEGVTQVMFNQAGQLARGTAGSNPSGSIFLENVANDTIGRCGNYRLGVIGAEELPAIRQIIMRLEQEVLAADLYTGFKRTDSEILVLRQELHDHLAVITLRRVVPGSCRYCPI